MPNIFLKSRKIKCDHQTISEAIHIVISCEKPLITANLTKEQHI